MDLKSLVVHGRQLTEMFGQLLLGTFELKNRVNKIPDEVDILVTHSPPFGILDAGHGSQSLRERVLKVRPKVHIFGHNHHEWDPPRRIMYFLLMLSP
ncbi:hypothetical protein [Bdellovibrio sp. HCB-162]|uniref:hypothetical protein n=1 Tax=Bdellovibrio sp. HCB-162 TaxID=3394234 RepID=UPI0039BD5161